jgi:hypothetical protein
LLALVLGVLTIRSLTNSFESASPVRGFRPTDLRR